MSCSSHWYVGIKSKTIEVIRDPYIFGHGPFKLFWRSRIVSFCLFLIIYGRFYLFASLSLFFCRIQRVMLANCLLLCVSLCFFLSRKSANLLVFVCCCPYDSAFIANLLAFWWAWTDFALTMKFREHPWRNVDWISCKNSLQSRRPEM